MWSLSKDTVENMFLGCSQPTVTISLLSEYNSRKVLLFQTLMSLRHPGVSGAEQFGLAPLIDIIRCDNSGSLLIADYTPEREHI